MITHDDRFAVAVVGVVWGFCPPWYRCTDTDKRVKGRLQVNERGRRGRTSFYAFLEADWWSIATSDRTRMLRNGHENKDGEYIERTSLQNDSVHSAAAGTNRSIQGPSIHFEASRLQSTFTKIFLITVYI